MPASILHSDARDIFSAGLAAVDAYAAVDASMSLDGSRLRIRGSADFVTTVKGVRLVAVGKAAPPMVRAAERILGPLLRGGVCVTKDGHAQPTRVASVLEAGHPLPDNRSLEAGRRVVQEVRSATPDELLLVLLSGGASALVEVLPPSVSLDDLQILTDLLLRSGAPIEEVNCVRRAVSRIKAGGLLLEVPDGVASIVLVISDVLGSPLDIIGSGPMCAHGTSASDALVLLDSRGLTDRVPVGLRTALHESVEGERKRARRLGLRADRVVHSVIADNRRMAEAAERMARQRGYHTMLLSTFVEGEARDVGTFFAGLAREIAVHGGPVEAPACVLASGETTVTVRGSGRGGRNQETALSFALHAQRLPRTVLLCGASDGTDGPTDAAGAIADGQTTIRAQALGLDARACLANNDAYRYFERMGDLLMTGPTGTNTNDLLVLLAGARPTS